MITALSLADKNGTDVPLMTADEKVLCTDVDGLWGIESPRQVKRSRPTGHGALNDTRYGDGRLVSLAFEAIGSDYADTLSQFRTVTAPMVQTWDYGAAALKWTEGVDARQGLTNLVPNPSIEVDTSNWTAGSGETLSRTTADSRQGTACLELSNTADNFGRIISQAAGTAPVTAGQTVFARLSLKPVSISAGTFTSVSLRVRWFDGGGALISETAITTVLTPPVGTWQDMSGSLVAPANTASAAVVGIYNADTASNIIWRVDRAMLAVTSNQFDYFDGDSEFCYWTGTQGLSTSVFDHSLQRLVKLDSDVTPHITSGDDRRLVFQSQFFAEDPRAYHTRQRTVTGAALSTASGGMVFPMKFPVKFTPSGGGTATVVNRGNRDTPPVFRIYGMCVNPAIVNVTTGDRITINGTIANGDYLELNVADRSAKLNGSTTQNNLVDSANTSWFTLPSGTTNLQLIAGTFDGTARLDTLLRDAYA